MLEKYFDFVDPSGIDSKRCKRIRNSPQLSLAREEHPQGRWGLPPVPFSGRFADASRWAPEYKFASVVNLDIN